ncbi:MAG: hypothetical protein C4B58_07780 [Deltaproteobacteria bacterium]|nr:MAG: hypothetical protein C4B58_07780 [Deltaproteobacteria bacterium]
MSDKQRQLFKTKVVPGKPGSGKLFEEELVTNNRPVECLGMTFENDEKRRKYFLEKLREKLKDPEFRKIEGFPIGEDEDILALSDPPYYTACPNPFIGDFIQQYGKPYDPNVPYSKEPFASDVSEGKNHPIYNAHSYHTKVPHKAIMRYILHYTEPGDVVFDGFCGTGMTGVAAQMCGDRATVESLGYQVKPEGTILRQEKDGNGKSVWVPFSILGIRRAVLNDLSPAATFIAYNYNTPVDVVAFERGAKRILKEFEKKTKWMWETIHSDGKTVGKINYVVWSEVYSCPECTSAVVYYKEAFRENNGKVVYTPEFKCPSCGSLCAKSPSRKLLAQKLERLFTTVNDDYLGEIVKKQKRVPILINYSIGTKRHEKELDNEDICIISKIGRISASNVIPTNRMPKGDEARRNDDEGITNTHHFYTERILASIVALTELVQGHSQLNFLIGSMLPKLTIMNRYMPQHGGRALVGPMANTLYVPPVSVENNVIDQLWFQFKKIVKALNSLKGSLISTQAVQQIHVPDNSADYSGVHRIYPAIRRASFSKKTEDDSF